MNTRTKNPITTSPSRNAWEVIKIVKIFLRGVFRASVAIIVRLLAIPAVEPITVIFSIVVFDLRIDCCGRVGMTRVGWFDRLF